MKKLRFILINKKRSRNYKGHNNLIICKFDNGCNELPICAPVECSALQFLQAQPKMKQIVELLNSSDSAFLGVKRLSIYDLDNVIANLKQQLSYAE